jgi:hypothetical protein
MRMSKLFLFSLALSTSLSAQDVKVVGTLEHNFYPPHNTTLNTTKTAPQSIKLLKIELNNSAVNTLSNRTLLAQNKNNVLATNNNLPRKVDLGMNDVPVLDQGSYGSCVTFANTAALDAALNHGDYISQLCQLQLGKYLEENGYATSGWNGSLGRVVLSQIDKFGIVSKEQQRTAGCGGLTEYPAHNAPMPETAMSLEQFHQISESLDEKAAWSPILDIFEAIDKTDTTKTLNDIKLALNEKDRVTFGVLLLDFDLGLMGAVGTHHTSLDTWVLTPEISRDIWLRPNFGGHEMVITGYDDDAVATDDKGHEHKGLLTLRNSWGDQLGDKGNFYMSYDYFKVLVIEAQRIRTMPADGGLSSITA